MALQLTHSEPTGSLKICWPSVILPLLFQLRTVVSFFPLMSHQMLSGIRSAVCVCLSIAMFVTCYMND